MQLGWMQWITLRSKEYRDERDQLCQVQAWSSSTMEANSESFQRGNRVEMYLETIDRVPGRRVHYSRIQKIDPLGGYCSIPKVRLRESRLDQYLWKYQLHIYKRNGPREKQASREDCPGEKNIIIF